MKKVLVSSCLLGCKVRYDGGDNLVRSEDFQQFVTTNEMIPFCPEVAGGLSIPRMAAEICNGTAIDVLNNRAQVMNKDGTDVTRQFICGAKAALEMCQKHNIKHAVLTESSPSCASSLIYNGYFQGAKILGKGVTCTLLELHGIKVVNQFHVFDI